MNEFPIEFISVFSNNETQAKGNISSVILLDQLLDDSQLQSIATELHQPATTFLAPTAQKNQYQIRWFAPDAEIQLCGHGAMAATVFLNKRISSDVGGKLILSARNQDIEGNISEGDKNTIQLNKINYHPESNPPAGLEEALGQQIIGYYETDNKQIVQLKNEDAVKNMKPNFPALRKIDVFGYAVTAESSNTDDYVCRTLVPHVQQLEDHATGSTQAILAGFWAQQIGKDQLIARQLSPRGGYFEIEVLQNQLTITAQSNTLLKGTYSI